jgi:hypothetical protein
MIDNFDCAKEVNELLLRISGLMDASVADVDKRCSPQDAAAYRRAVGKVLVEILLELLNPLYLRHPSLRPEGL